LQNVILAAMIKNHIKVLLQKNLSLVPTHSQSELIDGLSEYISSDVQDEIMLIKGYAGTGKTTMINALIHTLASMKIRSVMLAPTGRASKVMSGYTGRPAFTIHKKIYRQQSFADGMGKFVLDKNFFRDTYFIVDEASMISNERNKGMAFGSGRLLDDLLEFVYSGVNCRLVLVGDTAQLPPVGLPISPALDAGTLKFYGFGVHEVELKDVVRQALHSGILHSATQIRKKIGEGFHTGFFPLDIDSFEDVERLSGENLVEAVTTHYEKNGIFETIVITRSNKRANLYNKGIRGSILYRENEIEKGDLLMVVKNNYFWNDEDGEPDFIANGDIAEVISISGYEALYGFRFADVCLRFVDYENIELDCKIFLDTLSIEAASFSYDQNRQLFDAVSEDYPEIRNKRNLWKKVRENPHFNALQVKYAYALTCHKAQGGQWKTVFIDHGYLVEDMLDNDYYRWLYTAFTRPVKKLFLVNFNKNFFEKSESEGG
jgi:exodeoxyribonuclease V